MVLIQFSDTPSVFVTLILFFLVLHRYPLMFRPIYTVSVSSSYPISSYFFCDVIWLCNLRHTVLVRYFLPHFSSPLPYLSSFVRMVYTRVGALVRTRTLTYFRLPTVPAVLLATFPLGVERRVCCGSERGSVWSVGWSVCCPCVSFMSCRRPCMSLMFSSISGAVLGLERVHDVPTVRMKRVVYDSAFADELAIAMNKFSLNIR
jgi:hypothetical protein